jgi:hypothetical protein
VKKLPIPTISFKTALSAAFDGMGSAAYRAEHETAFKTPEKIESHYSDRATMSELYNEPRIIGAADPIVLGALSKSQLTRLYTQYFVPQKKPARPLYEEIKVTANGKCPLCGDVGHVRTLDHYLPKSNFPVYSILPINLVPCCRDCNSEKLDAFANTVDQQTLHPYFDHDRFFSEKWISARVIRTTPPVVDYFVDAPARWQASDRSRVESHFREYRLGNRFSVEAAADLPETIHTRRTTMAKSSDEEFSGYLSEKSQTANLPINNWRRVMFTALAADEWFCNQTFIGV